MEEEEEREQGQKSKRVLRQRDPEGTEEREASIEDMKRREKSEELWLERESI